MPCLLTVVGSANTPRPPSVRRQMAHKLAATPGEYAALLRAVARVRDRGGARGVPAPPTTSRSRSGPPTTSASTPRRIGLAGSPTQVHKVNFVVLESTESKTVQPTPEAIAAMVAELVHEYIVG